MKAELVDVGDNEMFYFLNKFASVVKNGVISVEDFNKCLRDERLGYHIVIDEEYPEEVYVYRGY